MDQGAKTIKLLYEKIRENLHDLGVGNGILDIIPKEFNKRKNR